MHVWDFLDIASSYFTRDNIPANWKQNWDLLETENMVEVKKYIVIGFVTAIHEWTSYIILQHFSALYDHHQVKYLHSLSLLFCYFP
jgi:hypothetical protein